MKTNYRFDIYLRKEKIMSTYHGFIISDIHVGAMNLEQLHKEYQKLFIEEIRSAKKLDFIIVGGDFFDRKFYLNDPETTMAYRMLKELLEACKERNIPIRFVYGTESHECDQYNIMDLLKIYENIRVIKYAEEEELLPGLNVLYLPEEYLFNKDEYYEPFFKNHKKYDYIFGHGVIREVMKEQVAHIENSQGNTKRKKVPIFSSSELSYCCKGQVFFGHYHINYDIDEKIFSIGSFSRWKFGEEGKKGYYKVECTPEKKKYKAEYRENTLTDKYDTVSFGYDAPIFSSVDALQEASIGIDKMIEKSVKNHVRFIFNIPTQVENPEATVNYLKERFKQKDNVKIEIVHGYIEEKKKQQQEEVDETNKKYAFIYDNNLTLEDKTSRFLSIEYNKELPIEEVAIYLYKPLQEILED